MVRRCLVLHFLVVRLVSTLAAVGCLIKIYYKEIRTVGQMNDKIQKLVKRPTAATKKPRHKKSGAETKLSAELR